jgi:hypothetical protein
VEDVSTGRRFLLLALLGFAPIPAYAHGVPVWMFVAALSPLLVLMLIAVYGWLARTPRTAFVHALLQAIWVIWFWGASNSNEVALLGVSTDYIIWTAFALYVLHTILIVVLVFVHASRRLMTVAQPTVQGPTSPPSAEPRP